MMGMVWNPKGEPGEEPVLVEEESGMVLTIAEAAERWRNNAGRLDDARDEIAIITAEQESLASALATVMAEDSDIETPDGAVVTCKVVKGSRSIRRDVVEANVELLAELDLVDVTKKTVTTITPKGGVAAYEEKRADLMARGLRFNDLISPAVPRRKLTLTVPAERPSGWAG